MSGEEVAALEAATADGAAAALGCGRRAGRPVWEAQRLRPLLTTLDCGHPPTAVDARSWSPQQPALRARRSPHEGAVTPLGDTSRAVARISRVVHRARGTPPD